jgi:hypothetical protein
VSRRAYRPDRSGSVVLALILIAMVLLLAWWFLATGNANDTPGESPAVTEPAEPGTPEAPDGETPEAPDEDATDDEAPGEDEATPEAT